MNETSVPEQSARTRLLRFLNKEHAIPETLIEYRKALQLLFEDLKLEVALEVASIKDILEIEAYQEELDSAIYNTETDLSQEIKAAEEKEAVDPGCESLLLLLRREYIVDFNLNEPASHPDRSVELRKIERCIEDFKEEVLNELLAVLFDDLIKDRIDQRRTDTLDGRLDRRFEFAFFDRLCGVSRLIKNEEELQAFEIFLLLEKYTCLNFAWEIDSNFSSYRTEVTKEYLKFLLKRLREFRRISAAAHMELPEKDKPLYSRIKALLAQRRQLHQKLFREMELQIREKMKHQEICVFPRDRAECCPITAKDEIFMAWLDDSLDKFRMRYYCNFLTSKQKIEELKSLAKDPRAWGPEEHETVLRLKEYNAMVRIPTKEFVLLEEFWLKEGMETGFMVRF